LGPLSTAATNRPIVPAPGDYDDGKISGMMIGRGNRSTGRKPAPVLLCPPQTPHACSDTNPGRYGGKPATNCLSYGMDYKSEIWLAIMMLRLGRKRRVVCKYCLLLRPIVFLHEALHNDWAQLTQNLKIQYIPEPVVSNSKCIYFLFARCKPACQT
jgi:hypothetical protein